MRDFVFIAAPSVRRLLGFGHHSCITSSEEPSHSISTVTGTSRKKPVRFIQNSGRITKVVIASVRDSPNPDSALSPQHSSGNVHQFLPCQSRPGRVPSGRETDVQPTVAKGDQGGNDANKARKAIHCNLVVFGEFSPQRERKSRDVHRGRAVLLQEWGPFLCRLQL